jgi:outer membrane protein OmpA-like peptidoglycan-associated protein
MKSSLIAVMLVMGVPVAFQTGCATKKYVRNKVAERVQPLENRTTELEETSRRNSQQIGELNSGLTDVRGRTAKAQETADRASASAEQANSRVASVETSVEDIRANVDKYSVQNTFVVFFRLGSARLTREAQAQLDQMASQITDRDGFVLEITGYGDTGRSTRYNENLGQLRAEAVQRYLADRDNIPVMRMFALGFGAARPMSQNVSAGSSASLGPQASPALNHRVEIKLMTHAVRQGSRARTISGQDSQRP